LIGEIGDSSDGIKDDEKRVAYSSPEVLDNDSGKSVAGVGDSDSQPVGGNESEVPSESEAPNKLEVPNKSKGPNGQIKDDLDTGMFLILPFFFFGDLNLALIVFNLLHLFDALCAKISLHCRSTKSTNEIHVAKE